MRIAIHLDCAWCGTSGGPAGESAVTRDMEPPGFHVYYECETCGFHNTIEVELGFTVHLSDSQKRVLKRAINEAAKEPPLDYPPGVESDEEGGSGVGE